MAPATFSQASQSNEAGLQGRVHGGQQPIAGAAVQLYAVGQNGPASAATPLLASAAQTGDKGQFSLSGYTCPSPMRAVYLVATGGNPGLYSTTNPSIALMTALGPCGQLDQARTVTINEVTTVSAVWALAPYMQGYASVGADASSGTSFAAAWEGAAQMADIATGAAPGTGSANTVPVTKINSLANILASCVNSSGGRAGDGSVCGQLFAASTADGITPADTVAAALNMERHPAQGVARLFDLAGAVIPFEPQLASAPADWGLSSTPAGIQPTFDFPPLLPSLRINLAGPTLDPGRITAGTVTLSLPAPAGGLTVALSSAPAGVISLPGTVSIAAGQTSGRIVYTGTTLGAATLSASATGYTASSASLTVQLPVAQPKFFGMSVLDFGNVTPRLTFGTARSWDAYPALDWAESNPAPGVFLFSQLNAWIQLNQAQGRDMIYTFGRTPQWASTQPNAPGAYSPGQCAAPQLDAWDAYVTAAALASAGRIKYWEVWNEWDQPGFYCGDIPTMVAMAQHAYAIIKAIDPSATVFSPTSVGGAGAHQLALFMLNGGIGSFDAVAFHGYEGTNAEAIVPIVWVYRNALNVFGVPWIPLWDTEFSWGDNPIGDDAHRAAFLAKEYVLHWSSGVDRALWYAYDGQPEWGRLVDDNLNLLPDGVAYGQVQNWIEGATLFTPCAADSGGTWTCGITRAGGYSATIAWNSSSAVTFAVPAGATRFRDLGGNVTPLYAGTVSVGNMPLLFETGAP